MHESVTSATQSNTQTAIIWCMEFSTKAENKQKHVHVSFMASRFTQNMNKQTQMLVLGCFNETLCTNDDTILCLHTN